MRITATGESVRRKHWRTDWAIPVNFAACESQMQSSRISTLLFFPESQSNMPIGFDRQIFGSSRFSEVQGFTQESNYSFDSQLKVFDLGVKVPVTVLRRHHLLPDRQGHRSGPPRLLFSL